MTPQTPHILVSLVALGMSIAFYSADRRSSTSRALAATLGSTGIAIFLSKVLIRGPDQAPPWSGWLAIPESLAIICMLEWLLRVRLTVPAPADFDTRTGDRLLRFGQLAGVTYGVFALIWPQDRLRYFIGAAGEWSVLSSGPFWLFATPILLATLTGLVAMLMLLNRRPDGSEKMRVLAMAAAVPFLVGGFILPAHSSPISMVIGEMVLLTGSVHYHVMQGRRGQFMSRFLSPEVARLVSERGLSRAMQENSLTISVVACDLRGFTAFARAVPSDVVIRVLREYYDAVGRVVADYGGTIKDYAGDGVLILVGAPIPMPDHARRAVELAVRLRQTCRERIEEWSGYGPRLGIGVGVASGPVTVGVIGGVSRLEYTAVGSAVNLASRLCEQASDGEILLDRATVEAAGARAQPRQPVQIKGFAEPVPIFCG